MANPQRSNVKDASLMQTTRSSKYQLPTRNTWERRLRRYWHLNGLAYLLLVPSLLFLVAIEFVPLAKGLNEALYFHKLTLPWLDHFVGLGNFSQAWGDPEVRQALKTSVLIVTGTVGGSYALGLLAGVLLNQRLRLGGLYRALILVPWVVPFLVTCYAWNWMLNDQSGIINQILLSLHIINTPILFLADPHLALASLIVVGIQMQFPFLTITVLAALSAIPDDLNEAANIDGANRWQTFRCITFPLIVPVSIVAVLLQCIWTFNNWGLPFVLTGGGPANATTPLILLAYKEAFTHYDIGYGTSLAVITMVLMLGLGAVYLRLQPKPDSGS